MKMFSGAMCDSLYIFTTRVAIINMDTFLPLADIMATMGLTLNIMKQSKKRTKGNIEDDILCKSSAVQYDSMNLG